MRIGVFHQVYSNKIASEFIIQNFRKHHPDSPYTLICDGGVDYSDLAKKYKCNYIHCFINLGKPGNQKCKVESEVKINICDDAFGKEEVLIWLNRFNQACQYTIDNECSHIIMLEDDVYITNPITFQDDWKFASFSNVNNIIKQDLLDYLIKRYGAKFNVNYYTCGGGTIFDAKIFHKNYYKIHKFINDEFYNMYKLDNRIGWLDFYMQIIYHTMGCDYSHNPQATELWRNVNHFSNEFSIINQWKEFYTK